MGVRTHAETVAGMGLQTRVQREVAGRMRLGWFGERRRDDANSGMITLTSFDHRMIEGRCGRMLRADEQDALVYRVHRASKQRATELDARRIRRGEGREGRRAGRRRPGR